MMVMFLCMRVRRVAVWGALMLSLSVQGCATGAGGGGPPALYDFGPMAVSSSAATPGGTSRSSGSVGRRPALAVAEVLAPSWLDGQLMFYRLGFADARQPRPYAESRWAMPPAHLLTLRARARLGQVVDVLAEGDLPSAPVLRIEVEEFVQVFDTPAASRGVVRWRASLLGNGRLLAQRHFVLERPASSANASGGVRALTEASDAALDELATWVTAQLAR